MDFNFGSVLAGGAVVGLLTSFWGYIKEFGWKIINTLIEKVDVVGYEANQILVGYMLKKYKKSSLYTKSFASTNEWQRSTDSVTFNGPVPYENFTSLQVVFWNGWFPFYCYCPNNAWSMQLLFFRGSLDINAIITEAYKERNELLYDHLNKSARRFNIIYIPDFQDKMDKKDAAPATKDANGNNATAAAATIPESSKSSNSLKGDLEWFMCNHYRLVYHKPEELGLPKGDGNALKKLYFPPDVVKLQEEIKIWISNRKWYSENNVPWKRGWILYGPPGTGKTAIVRAFAQDLDLPVFVYNLGKMYNEELLRAWHAMQQYTPCIALFEDFDNIFHGRKNVVNDMDEEELLEIAAMYNGAMPIPRRKYCGLTFDCFLNCLDGIERAEGVFTIITTNNIDKIDEAIGKPRKNSDGSVEYVSTRPGRIDKVIKLDYMRNDDKKKLAYRLLGKWESKYQEFIEYVDQNPNLQETPAQVQERCSQIALQCFWEEKQRKIEKEVKNKVMSGAL